MDKEIIKYPHERLHEHSLVFDCEHCLNSYGCLDNNIPCDASDSDLHFCHYLMYYADRLEYYRELNEQIENIDDDLPF